MFNFLEKPYNTWPSDDVLKYFQNRNDVKYFPVRDEEETTREKIDNILINRFNFNNETYDMPVDFDWTINPSADIEWHIMIHKFYYAVGLGCFYHETKNRAYVKKWMDLISSWINNVPIDFLTSDVIGRRIQNWIFSHYYFVTLDKAPDISAGFYINFLESIHRQTEYLCDNLTPARNHRTLELYAIFLVAVVFPELRSSDKWLDFAKDELFKNIQSDILDDGVQCELSTDYHHIVLRNYLGVRKLAQLNNIDLPERMDTLIKKALEFSLYVHKPDGLIPSLSDGDTACFLDLLKQGYDLYGSEEILYVASKGKRGKSPAYRSKAFHDSGYYILRSGWGNKSSSFEDERYLCFDCGPLGTGNHGHLDLLSIEMAAYGQSLIVDPGRYTYDESGPVNWRVLFRGTQYHNTVLVDKKNQTNYVFYKKKFKIKGKEPERDLKTFKSMPGFDYLHGVARSHEYDAIHERKIFFLCPDYWIISDILQANDQHEYDLLFHLSDKAHGKTSMRKMNDTVVINAPNLIIGQACNKEVRPIIEDGYISPVYGVKYPAPIARFNCSATSTAYHTVLYPYKYEKPDISVKELVTYRAGDACHPLKVFAICITIKKDEEVFEDFYFSAEEDIKAEYSFGDFTFNGSLLFLRKDTKGGIINIISTPNATLKEFGVFIK